MNSFWRIFNYVMGIKNFSLSSIFSLSSMMKNKILKLVFEYIMGFLGIYNYAMRIFMTNLVFEYAFEYIVKIPTFQ